MTQPCPIDLHTSSLWFRNPKGAERLVLYLKDLNLPKPDMYTTVQLVSFLQQLITYEGYFDSNLEWCVLTRDSNSTYHPSFLYELVS